MTNKTAITNNFNSIQFSLNLGRWKFAPSLIPTLAVLLLLPLLISLGCWQWRRAETKQQLLDQFAARSHQSPQALTGHPLLYTPIQITGRYEVSQPILLDNRILNHRVGYDVLLPFVPADGKPALLVNLGWIPKFENGLDDYLRRLQEQPQQSTTIIGLSQIPEHNLVLSQKIDLQRRPLVIEDIRIDQLSQQLNRSFYPFILLLTSPGGFTPHWDIVTTITPARHRGYAVQWFALAFTLIILYLKLNTHRRSL